jgi:hypothetical protein
MRSAKPSSGRSLSWNRMCEPGSLASMPRFLCWMRCRAGASPPTTISTTRRVTRSCDPGSRYFGSPCDPAGRTRTLPFKRLLLQHEPEISAGTFDRNTPGRAARPPDPKRSPGSIPCSRRAAQRSSRSMPIKSLWPGKPCCFSARAVRRAGSAEFRRPLCLRARHAARGAAVIQGRRLRAHRRAAGARLTDPGALRGRVEPHRKAGP